MGLFHLEIRLVKTNAGTNIGPQSNIYLSAPEIPTLKVRPNVQALLDKHFGFCLSSKLVHLATLLDKHILLVNFRNVCCSSQMKNVCQERVCVKNIMLDKQNFKCLPNNACSLGRGLMVHERDASPKYLQLKYSVYGPDNGFGHPLLLLGIGI